MSKCIICGQSKARFCPGCAGSTSAIRDLAYREVKDAIDAEFVRREDAGEHVTLDGIKNALLQAYTNSTA